MDIFAIEDMEHVDALEFTRAHKIRQSTANLESDEFSWMARQ